MDSRSLFSGLGKLVAALVCLAFAMTPMASAQHMDAAPEEVCAVEHTEGASESGMPAAPDHDHHAHGCGACHVHLIGSVSLLASGIDSTRSNVRPLPAADIGSALLRGLFRPPRV